MKQKGMKLLICLILSAMIIAGCEFRIAEPPSEAPDFMPVGEFRECSTCGQRALDLCQERDPESYPIWYGFNGEGNCTAYCSGPDTLRLDIGGIEGSPHEACSYEVNTTVAFTEEVCPSGEPSVGDREFSGHGPEVIGTISVKPDASGERVEGFITATWTETEPDGSSITLEPTLVGRSNRLSFNPSSIGAKSVIVDSIVSASSTTFTREMESGEEAIIEPADGNLLVNQLVIVGDTAGGDISDDNDCNDDARVISVIFNPVRVLIGPAP